MRRKENEKEREGRVAVKERCWVSPSREEEVVGIGSSLGLKVEEWERSERR